MSLNLNACFTRTGFWSSSVDTEAAKLKPQVRDRRSTKHGKSTQMTLSKALLYPHAHSFKRLSQTSRTTREGESGSSSNRQSDHSVVSFLAIGSNASGKAPTMIGTDSKATERPSNIINFPMKERGSTMSKFGSRSA